MIYNLLEMIRSYLHFYCSLILLLSVTVKKIRHPCETVPNFFRENRYILTFQAVVLVLDFDFGGHDHVLFLVIK